MPEIYQSGEDIPEFGGTVSGGTTIVIHRPEDVEILQDICRAASLSDEPLATISDVLDRTAAIQPVEESSEEFLITISDILTSPEFEIGEDEHETSDRSDEGDIAGSKEDSIENLDDLNDAEWLIKALGFAREIWLAQEADEYGFDLAMLISDSEFETESRIEIESANPALVFHRGSLKIILLKGALIAGPGVVGRSIRVLSAAVVIIPRRRILPEDQAKALMESLRTKALEKAEPLERFDEVKPEQLYGKEGVIIFIHGLLSTDAGLFDGLLTRLRNDKTMNEAYFFVGWPHDTLKQIDVNAMDLVKKMSELLGTSSQRVVFVCHSRGGLVARSTAVKLYEKKGENWTKRLGGCVTFGTPHAGAELAASPFELLGTFVAVQALIQTKSFLSFGDMLYYVHAYPDLKGITDLRPMRDKKDFLYELTAEEVKLAEPAKMRLLDILALGGKAPNEEPKTSLAKAIFDDDEHDLVVRTASTIFDSPLRKPLPCNHFKYFDLEPVIDLYYDEVFNFIKRALDYDAVKQKRESNP